MLLFDFLIKVPLCECVCDSGCYQCHGRLQMLMGGGKGGGQGGGGGGGGPASEGKHWSL